MNQAGAASVAASQTVVEQAGALAGTHQSWNLIPGLGTAHYMPTEQVSDHALSATFTRTVEDLQVNQVSRQTGFIGGAGRGGGGGGGGGGVHTG